MNTDRFHGLTFIALVISATSSSLVHWLLGMIFLDMRPLGSTTTVRRLWLMNVAAVVPELFAEVVGHHGDFGDAPGEKVPLRRLVMFHLGVGLEFFRGVVCRIEGDGQEDASFFRHRAGR